MGYVRPDPRAERLDARLRDLPAASLHPLLDAVAEIDFFAGWWSARFARAPAFLSDRRARAVAEGAAASGRIDWTGLPGASGREQARRLGAGRSTCYRLAHDVTR